MMPIDWVSALIFAGAYAIGKYVFELMKAYYEPADIIAKVRK